MALFMNGPLKHWFTRLICLKHNSETKQLCVLLKEAQQFCSAFIVNILLAKLSKGVYI